MMVGQNGRATVQLPHPVSGPQAGRDWFVPLHQQDAFPVKKGKEKTQKMELRGIEPRTSPMLREYYTTKPQPHLLKDGPHFFSYKPNQDSYSATQFANRDTVPSLISTSE